MPRGPMPAWRQRKEPILDNYLLASITRATGGHDPANGFFATLVITGLADRAEAGEYIRALHRSGRYLTRWGGSEVGVHCEKPRKDADGTWRLEFRAVDKTCARKYILEKYGPDRSKWPYDPRRRGGG